MKTVTVFVKRQGGLFVANTHAADAMADSATTAARLAAARHFMTGEERIELTPDGEHVLIASVRPLAIAQELGCPWWGHVLIALHVPPFVFVAYLIVRSLWLDMTGGAR